MIKECFYITGRGGSIHEGLGSFLKSRSREVTGISLSPAFLQQPFEEQIAAIQSEFPRLERNHVPVIANSSGAYLLLNSLIGLPSLQTRVLIMSPVIGTLVSEVGYFKPPHAKRIPTALTDGTLRKPARLDICSGSINPDTNVGGNLTTREVFHGKTTSFIFHRV